MIYRDDAGVRHAVKVLGHNGPYRYVEMPDGSTQNVHWSTLSGSATEKAVPRFIPNPEPYRTPSKRGAKR